MKNLFILLIPVVSLTALAQQPPGTEIYLFDMKVKKNAVTLTNPKNITNRKGYDNQPFFHPEKPLLYYASANTEGRTDIIEYNYATGASRKITETPEREYSPTVTPDKKFLSCIIQRDNGAQDLGKYPIDGGEPVIVVDNLTVGYHAWINENQLIAFILPQPFTLQVIDVPSGKATVLTQNIGRSLHKIPNQNAMSFVQQLPDKRWAIKKLDSNALEITDVVIVDSEKEPIITWTPGGLLIRSMELELYSLRPGKDVNWNTVDVKAPLTGASRMAVNGKGNKMAVVISE